MSYDSENQQTVSHCFFPLPLIKKTKQKTTANVLRVIRNKLLRKDAAIAEC